MAFDASSFNQIPASLNRPGPRVEFDLSRMQSGLPRPKVKVLLAGQKLASGSATAGVPVRILSPVHARAIFGQGSMLAGMVDGYWANDTSTEIWGLPLADNAGGVAATKTITITGPATAAGTLALMICDQRVQVAVAPGDTATTVATAVAAAVNAYPDLPLTAGSAAGVVTLTARHKGLESNSLYHGLNYHPGDVTPAGLTVALAAGVGGTGNPDATAVFTGIGDGAYQYIIHPWNDDANMDVIEAALADRAGASKMNYGLAVSCNMTSYANLTTAAAARNSTFAAFAGIYNSPTPSWKIAGAIGAQVAVAATLDPARPFNGLVLKGVLPPPAADRFDDDERELLLGAGITTLALDASDNVVIERLVTSYKTNAQGYADRSLKDANAILTLYYLSWDWQGFVATNWPRMKLSNDADIPRANTVTPAIIRSGAAARAKLWFDAGLIENLEQFVADLAVQRDPNDIDRVNLFFRPDLVNGLQVTATLIQPLA